jgi:hypothetical protein
MASRLSVASCISAPSKTPHPESKTANFFMGSVLDNLIFL